MSLKHLLGFVHLSFHRLLFFTSPLFHLMLLLFSSLLLSSSLSSSCLFSCLCFCLSLSSCLSLLSPSGGVWCVCCLLCLSACGLCCLLCVWSVVSLVRVVVVIVVVWCPRGGTFKNGSVVWHVQKKPPCVDSKRPRVYRHHARMCYHMRAWCRYTRGRFESYTRRFFETDTRRAWRRVESTHDGREEVIVSSAYQNLPM